MAYSSLQQSVLDRIHKEVECSPIVDAQIIQKIEQDLNQRVPLHNSIENVIEELQDGVFAWVTRILI